MIKNFKVSIWSALVILLFSVSQIRAQNIQEQQIEEIEQYRDALNADYQDPEESPLTPEDFAEFSGLDFFPIDLQYYIVADFIRTEGEKPFQMATTTDEVKTYEKYGEVHFELHGQAITLNIYQSHALRETEEYRDYLFLPFRDKTNGNETYGGGRYLELWIPEGDSIVVDFNKAYNPYCVYNVKYSCPLVPKANWMTVPVYAGVKDFKKDN